MTYKVGDKLEPKMATGICNFCHKEYQGITGGYEIKQQYIADLMNRDNGFINRINQKPVFPYCSHECEQKEEEESIKIGQREIEEQAQQLIVDGMVPPKFRSMDLFEKFDCHENPKACDLISNLIKGGKTESFILCSPNLFGIGKTHLLCSLIIERAKDGMRSKYYSEADLMARIQDTYSRNAEETEADIIREMDKAGLLVIDEVGKYQPRNLSFVQGIFGRIIDHIYNGQCYTKAIGIATNLNLADLEIHLGGATTDRLRDMCGKKNIVIMTGKSRRGK